MHGPVASLLPVHQGDGRLRFRATYQRERDAAALLDFAADGALRVGHLLVDVLPAPSSRLRPRFADSDWTCRSCGKSNFPSRLECRSCCEPRDTRADELPSRSSHRSHQLPQITVPVVADMPPDGYVPHTSGYFFNAATGFFFDTQTSFYFVFDAPTQRFLFWDYNQRRYRVYPPDSFDETPSAAAAAVASTSSTAEATAQPPPTSTTTTAATAEYKQGSKPLKMTLGAKKAAGNIAQWSRMKELDAAAQAAQGPLVLDAFVKATEEDDAAAAAEAEAAQRRVRHQGRAPVSDAAATQPRPLSAQYGSLGRGPKNPSAASVPTAPAEPVLAPSVLLTAAGVVELPTRTADGSVVVGQLDTLTTLPSGNVACTLCLRQFPTRDKADRHVELSALHASNARARDSATREAALLLAERARQREQRQAEDRRAVRQRERDARDEMLAVERRLSERATLAAAAHRHDPLGPSIGDDNVGKQLLRKMGWRDGSGLGAQSSGIVTPVQATGSAGTNKAGLGSTRASSSSSSSSSYARHAQNRFDELGVDEDKQRRIEAAFFGTRTAPSD